MPFLLLDDAADQVKQRLSDFGDLQLQSLQSQAGSLGSAAAEAPASAQDITQRLMSFGQDQLSQALAAQQQQAAQGAQQLQSLGGDLASSAQQAGSGVADITGRLRDYGQQVLSDATASTQQGVQQLTPLNMPSQQGSITPFGDNQPIPAAGQIDSSSPQAFAQSVAPYAQAAAQQLGIDPKWVVAMMGSESNYGKAPGNELFGVKGSGTAGSQTLATHEGEYGGTAQNAGFAAYNSPQEAVSAWVDLIKGHYPGAVGAPDLATFVHGLKSGGYFTAAEDEYRNILQSITNNVGPAVDSALGGVGRVVNQAQNTLTSARDTAQQAGQQGLSNLSQFGDKELTAAQAYAACGPAAAVRFAQLFGRNPTLKEATDLASQVGWTAASGMAGLGSESKLFDAMQIPHRQVGADWAALQREASSGNPVVISTPGHYFTADGYDPSKGFHVGASGTDLRAGGEWMTPQQIEGVMGGLQGGLVVDHPLIGNSSVIAGGLTIAGNALKAGGQAAQRGLQALDGAIQDIGPQALDLASGGITRRFNEQLSNLGQTVTGGNQIDLNQGIKPLTSAAANALDTTAGTAESLGSAGPVSPELMRTAAGFLRQPGILDSMQVTQQLEAKYGTRDTSQYSPEDQQAYNQALLTVGGVLGSLNAEPVSGGSARMYHGTSGAFDRPDPGRFLEEGLYGPGYYLTSNADIAGGVVAGGGEQVGPAWLRSSVKRAPGEVVSPGYAQATPPTAISSMQADLADVTTRLSDPTISDRMRAMLEGRQSDLQRQVDAATPSSGPNVRAIDLPPVDNDPKALQPLGQPPTQSDKLHLFDMEAPLSPAARANVMDVLETDGDPYWVRDLVERSSSGQDVYDALARQGNRYANDTLQAAGFDGITHSGGARIPMTDAGGKPIQHDVAVVFPDSLDKLRNATSGTQGGETAAPFAAGLGGAAALAAGAKTAYDNRDQLGELKDQLGQRLEDFRQSQASSDPRDFSFTAPLTAGLGAAKDALEAQRQDQTTGMAQAVQDYLDAIKSKDPGAILKSAADLAQRSAGMGPGGGDADVSSPGSAGLTAAGVDPDVARVAGFAGNFVAPMALEAGLSRGGPLLARAAASDLARGESGALRLPGGGGTIDQSTLEGIRQRGIPGRPPPPPPPGSPQRIQWLTGTGPWAPPPARPTRGPIAQASDFTKQMMLTGPGTIGNIISNTGELIRSPIGLALGGRLTDAIAGGAAVTHGFPEAAQGALDIMRGRGSGNLSQEAIRGKWYEPVYKFLSASDQFTRTLAEYQRMAEEGSAMLRQAGIDPSDPAAASYLNAHATELQEAGRKGGADSVFAMADTPSSARNFLDNFFDGLNRRKNSLLDSPSLRDQALGAAMDFQIPFMGVPVRMLNLLGNRLPGTAQASGGYRAAKAIAAGNMPEAQRQIGNTVMESALQLLIAYNIHEGNIRGPDDPEHPNAALIAGHWVPLTEFGGGYTLPMQIMAAFAEGADRGKYQPASDEWNRRANMAGSGTVAALKPLERAIPGENMIHFLASLGQGPGKAITSQLSDTLGRIAAPGGGKWIEDILDPTQRDVSKQFPQSLWEPTQARIPGLAELLPEKVDMTTGEPIEKRSSGLGAILREQTGTPSELTVELKKLNARGYPIDAPTDYPDSVTIGNSKIKLKPDEQRAVARILGGTTDDLAGAFIADPGYKKLDDATKVVVLQRYLAAADKQRVSAALQAIPAAELNARLLAGERDIGGRPLSSGANLVEDTPFLNSSSLSAAEQAKALSR